MSITPEYILQTTLVRGIYSLRSDRRYVDQLFRNLGQKDVQQIRNFIREAIDICINYPREDLKVPAIVILLKSENESQAFLGNTLGLETPDDFAYDGEIEGELLGGVASVGPIGGQGKLVFGPYRADSGTANTLKTVSKNWSSGQFNVQNLQVSIVAGLGEGQIRTITANSQNTIMVSPNWQVIPDNTSVFEVREIGPEVIGEPSKLYDRRQNKFIERKGFINACNYQIQVIGSNPEQTIYLAIMVKAIFLLAADFLERQGLMNFKMSATDFVPRAEYQPTLSYMRAINVEFMSHFDIYQDLGTLATQLQTYLECGEDPNEDVISDTTTDLGKPVVEVNGP